MAVFFVLLLLFGVHNAGGLSSGTCGGSCRFRLCNPDKDASVLAKGADIILRAPRDAGYPYICSDPGTRPLSVVYMTGEAEVQTSIAGRTSLVPISKWRPSGFKPRIGKTFFKVAEIPLSQQANSNRLQSITRIKNLGNLDRLLDGQCIILPILSYKYADRVSRKSFRLEETTPQDCVAFTVRSPDLVVDLTWSLAENLDVMIRGPRGDSGVSIDRKKSFRISPDSINRCVGGQKSVIFNNARPGHYTVMYSNIGPGSTLAERTLSTFVTRRRKRSDTYPNCNTKEPYWPSRKIIKSPSKIRQKRKYELKVTWKGKVILRRSGKYRVGRQEKLGTVSFTIPA